MFPYLFSYVVFAFEMIIFGTIDLRVFDLENSKLRYLVMPVFWEKKCFS